MRNTTRFILPLGAALALVACGGEQETTYEADAEDLGGGELQVADDDAEGVPVELPEVEMTNVPPEEAEAMMEEQAAEEGAE